MSSIIDFSEIGVLDVPVGHIPAEYSEIGFSIAIHAVKDLIDR
jgi:hypothetical protein